MFGARFEIHLMPQQVALRRACRWLRGGVAEATVTEAGPISENQPAWTAAVAACGELLARDRRAGALRVIFSDLWARYDLIPLGKAELSDTEAMSLARAHFAHRYPDAAPVTWPLRLARQGGQLLVAAMDPALLTALNQMAAGADRRLVRAEPLFARTFDQHEQELSDLDGWMLLDEPGMLIAAGIERGRLLSLHCQRYDSEREEAAHLLLERQAALLGRAGHEVRIFSCSDRPLALREPWHRSQLRTIGPAAGRARAPSPIHRE